MKQHAKPCKECPFRRVAPPGWLGANNPQYFAVNAGNEGNFPCHLTMMQLNPPQCAGRATMWANQCKVSRDGSVMRVPTDRENVFGHMGEFIKHHGIVISPLQLMGIEPLDDDEEDYEDE